MSNADFMKKFKNCGKQVIKPNAVNNLCDEWQKTFVARIENMDAEEAMKRVKEIEL